MDKDFREGQTIWIDDSQGTQIEYKIRFIYSHRPNSIEHCHGCGVGQLGKMGRLIQYGFYGDKIYDVFGCLKCSAVTVFIYWVDPQ